MSEILDNIRNRLCPPANATSSGMDNIGPSTEEFLAKFGQAFAEAYPAAVFTRLKAEFEAKKPDNAGDSRQLQYREWKSINPPSPHSGTCWMCSGAGEGAFGSWSEVHLAELPDGNLGVFANAQAAAEADQAKAKQVIRTAGYELVREVSWHYREQVRYTCLDLDCERPEIGYPSHAWALAHGFRTNYIFQLHKPPGGFCACFGSRVQPEDNEADSNNRAGGDKWKDTIEKCLGYSSPRDLEKDEMAIAFEDAVNAMSRDITSLYRFSDDGTEGQILAHMAFLAVFEASCKSDVQEQIRRLPVGRLTAWMRARGAAAGTIEKLAEPAWKKMRDAAKAQSESVVETVRPLVHAIMEKKAQLMDLIRAKIGEKVGEKLSELLKPILSALTDPLVVELSNGVKSVLEIFKAEAKECINQSAVTGPLPEAAISALNKLARDSKKTAKINAAKSSLEDMLASAKRSNASIMEGLKPVSSAVKWRQSLLELLDGMAFTVQKLAAGLTASTQTEALIEDVLAKARADAAAVQRSFVSDLFVGMLMFKLKDLLKEHTGPVIADAQAQIPENMSKIIDVNAEYENLLDNSIGAAIAKTFEPRLS